MATKDKCPIAMHSHTQIRTTNLPHNQPLRKTAAGADCFDNAPTWGKNQRMGRGVSEALCKEGRHTFVFGQRQRQRPRWLAHCRSASAEPGQQEQFRLEHFKFDTREAAATPSTAATICMHDPSTIVLIHSAMRVCVCVCEGPHTLP